MSHRGRGPFKTGSIQCDLGHAGERWALEEEAEQGAPTRRHGAGEAWLPPPLHPELQGCSELAGFGTWAGRAGSNPGQP